MVNLNAFIAGLKTTWFRRTLLSSGKWNEIMKSTIQTKKLFTQGAEYLDTIKITNPFWKDAIKSYQSVLRSYEPKDSKEILGTPVFNNHKITIDRKHFIDKVCYDRGIHIVNDFIDLQGNFHTFEQFKHMYDVNINFLRYQNYSLD